MQNMIVNPILKGFYPDPSICRVGEDYYMVTSSFAYFPGVPVFHSRDLKNWEQLGYVLTRPEQLPLDARHISGGIYAPTIRHHDGVFYMITTNVDGIGDFVCTAEDPAGPWSDMHVIRDAPGIDPSLFWDDDGTCWMCGNDWSRGYGVLWAAKLDTEKFCLTTPRYELWGGAMVNAWAPEAPHLYKKDGAYYLMIAEGGTEFYHSVTIARSKTLPGAFEGFRGNPILTHRHLGRDFPISNTGHADLVETADGKWYMVLLASRPYGGYHLNMGRETFITPVDWSGTWPVVNPGAGRVEWTCPAPELPPCPFEKKDEDDFRSLVWNTLGTPSDDGDPVKAVDARHLLIRCTALPFIPAGEEEAEKKKHALGFYGRRQQHMSFTAEVKARVPARCGASCGLALLQNDFASLRLELMRLADGSVRVRALKNWKGAGERREEAVLGERAGGEEARLMIRADGQDVSLWAEKECLGRENAGFMGSESCGGFVGTYVGMYASGNGREWPDHAAFEDFSYRGAE